MAKTTITITIDNGNAAFDDDPAYEVRRIVADFVKRKLPAADLTGDDGGLMDINGNKVGTWEIVTRE